MNLVQYQKLKENADKARRKRDQATGALEQQYAELKRDFECKDLEQAQILDQKLEKEEKKLQKELDTELTELQENYPDLVR